MENMVHLVIGLLSNEFTIILATMDPDVARKEFDRQSNSAFWDKVFARIQVLE